MATIAAWLRSRSALAHSIAGFASFALILIASDMDIRNRLLALFKNHTDLGSAVVLGAICFSAYMTSLSRAGILAKARAIKEEPDAPTRAAVDAADVKAK